MALDVPYVNQFKRNSYVVLRRRTLWGTDRASHTYLGELLPADTFRVEIRFDDCSSYVMNRAGCGCEPVDDGTGLVHSAVVPKGACPEMLLIADNSTLSEVDPQEVNLGDAGGAYVARYELPPPELQPLLTKGEHLFRKLHDSNLLSTTTSGCRPTRLTTLLVHPLKWRCQGSQEEHQPHLVRQILRDTSAEDGSQRNLLQCLEEYIHRNGTRMLRAQFYVPSAQDQALAPPWHDTPDRYDTPHYHPEKETLLTLHGDFGLPQVANYRFTCGKLLQVDFEISNYNEDCGVIARDSRRVTAGRFTDALMVGSTQDSLEVLRESWPKLDGKHLAGPNIPDKLDIISMNPSVMDVCAFFELEVSLGSFGRCAAIANLVRIIDADEQRQKLKRLGEYRFYTDERLAARLRSQDLAIPKLLLYECTPDAESQLFLFTDLREEYPIKLPTRVDSLSSCEEVFKLIDWLSRLHASYWGSDDLVFIVPWRERWKHSINAADHETQIASLQRNWDVSVEWLRENVPEILLSSSSLATFGSRLAAAAVSLHNALAEGCPEHETLVHGDLQVQHCFFKPSPQVLEGNKIAQKLEERLWEHCAVSDWQFVGRGRAVVDLSCALFSFCKEEQDLALEFYFERLLIHAPQLQEHFSKELLQRQFELATLDLLRWRLSQSWVVDDFQKAHMVQVADGVLKLLDSGLEISFQEYESAFLLHLTRQEC